MASEQGGNVLQAATEILCEAFRVEREHLSEAIEFREFVHDNFLSGLYLIKRIEHFVRRSAARNGFAEMALEKCGIEKRWLLSKMEGFQCSTKFPEVKWGRTRVER
jgi:hypothetical protein